MAVKCPVRTKGWKKMQSVLGETEAYATWMNNNEEVPAVFEQDNLSNESLQLISKVITNKITGEEIKKLSAVLGEDLKKLKKLSKVDYAKIEKLNHSLVDGFLKDFNFNVQEYNKIKDDLGIGVSSMTDLLHKVLVYNREKSISREVAYVALSLLGKENNKLARDLRYNIHTWSKYQERFDFHKNRIFEEEGFINNTKEWKRTVRERVIADFLGETIVDQFHNETPFTKIPAMGRKLNKADFLEMKYPFLRRLLSQIKRVLRSIGIPVSSTASFDRLEEVSRNIAGEIISQEYQILDYKKNENQLQKDYWGTLRTDPKAEGIVNHILNKGAILVGSLALRKDGTMYRSPIESLHDLDFVVPYSTVKKGGILAKRLNGLASKFKTGKWLVGQDKKDFREASRDIIENSLIYKDIKRKYPGFKFVNTFFSGSNVLVFQGVIDGQYYTRPTLVRDGLNVKIAQTGDHIQHTGHFIDLFFKYTRENPYMSTDGIADFKHIMQAKFEFGRFKDFSDYKHFVPFATQSPDIFKTGKYIGRTYEANDKIIESIQDITKQYTVQKSEISLAEREVAHVTNKKIALLQKGLKTNVISDPSLKSFAQVDPYKAGETPTIRVNFTKVRKDTAIHEFGHVYIDLLGGMSNPMIQQGRKYVNGSELEARILADPKYAGLDQNTLDKEVLATAIGLEGSAQYDAMQGGVIERFQNWLKIFFNRLKKLIGVDHNVAMELARQMLTDNIQTSPYDAIGSEIIQRQTMPDNVTEEQNKTLKKINSIDSKTTLTEVGDFYDVLINGVVEKFQRNSNRIDEIWPGDKPDADWVAQFENSRQWGNHVDDIITGVIEGRSFDDVVNIVRAKEVSNPIYGKFTIERGAMEEIYESALFIITAAKKSGDIVLSQKGVYSEFTKVAGTTDILLIHPDGSVGIVDIKSSKHTTMGSYGRNNQYTYSDRGKYTSTKTKHIRQQSAYKKMYEDLGIKVKSIEILPFKIESYTQEGKKRGEVNGITAERPIELQYNKLAADKIIDNKQRKLTDKLYVDEDITKKLHDVTVSISSKVKALIKHYAESSKGSVWFERIQLLADDLVQSGSLESIISYIDQGHIRAGQITERLDEMISGNLEYDSQDLQNIIKFIGAFDLSQEVLNTFNSIKKDLNKRLQEVQVTEEEEESLKNKETSPDERNRILINKANENRINLTLRIMETKKPFLEELISKLNNIKSNYDVLSRDYIVELGTPHLTDGKERIILERAYRQKNEKGSLTTSEYDTAMKEWINEQMADQKASGELERKRREHMKEIVSTAPKDVSWSWVQDQKNLDDTLIQLTVLLLDKADHTSMREFIALRNKTTIIYEDYYNFMGKISDVSLLYSPLIEKDKNGKQTPYLVGKYLSQYAEDIKMFYEEYAKKGTRPTALETQQFYKKAKERNFNPQWVELQQKALDNPENPIVRMYEHLIERAALNDKITPDTYSLGIALADEYDPETKTTSRAMTYKLPSIEKNTVERVQEQGLWTAFNEGLKDLFIRDTNTTEHGMLAEDETGHVEKVNANWKRVYTDEQGKEKLFIPIHYRSNLRQENLQSYDLTSVYLMDSYMVMNYGNKKTISSDLELMKDIASSRKVGVRRGDAKLINEEGQKHTIPGLQSNSFKVLNSIIEDRIYGISSVDMGDISIFGKDISINKVAENVMKWTGATMLIANYYASGTGALQGKIMNMLEGIAGTNVSRANLRKSEAFYWSNIANTLDDIGKKVPNGIVNLLNERFNILSDFSGLENRFGDDSRAKQLLKGKTLHFMQNSQEHWVQSTLGIGILMEKEITNSKGETISLKDAYELNEHKQLVIKKGWEDIVTPELEFKMERKIREVINEAHGNYSNQHRAMAQRYVTGKMTFMMKKWLVSGVTKRWRGVGRLKHIRDREALDEYEKFYSEVLEEEKEGTYVTSLVFLRNILADAELLKFNLATAEQEWHILTSKEKANIRRTVAELAIIVLSYMAHTVLAKLAKAAIDDDDKKAIYVLAVLMRRLHSELAFYVDPSEIWRLTKSPAASLSMVQRTVQLMKQLMPWNITDRYKGGPRKGQLKIRKKIEKVIPIVSQADRNASDLYKMLDKLSI